MSDVQGFWSSGTANPPDLRRISFGSGRVGWFSDEGPPAATDKRRDFIRPSVPATLIPDDYHDLCLAAAPYPEITQLSRETLKELTGESFGDLMQDGVITSVLVAGAVQARSALSGGRIDGPQVRSTLELAGIGTATAVTVHALLSLL